MPAGRLNIQSHLLAAGPLLIMQTCTSSLQLVKELLSAYFTESSLWPKILSDQLLFMDPGFPKVEVLKHMLSVKPAFRCSGYQTHNKTLLNTSK